MVRQITTFIFLNLFVLVCSEAPENKTIANYDASELLLKIFNVNESASRASSSQEFLQPLSENDETKNYFYKNAIRFDDDTYDNYSDDNNGQTGYQDFVKFQDNKDVLNKKKRRKRKQKQQHYGLLNQGVRPNLGFNGIPYPGFEGQYQRPQRPRPSVTSAAISAVTDALSSIASNDDFQCVPRLLCEAAGGGALGTSGILQTISGLQPLLTLLSAYNGVSANPLIVFGRAVFLGMSSSGNTASCHYAYPLCPTDPERLVHYLNNHNGGFFRFFNSPQQGQQNIEQFYNHLSQSYGLDQQQQNYGLYNLNQQIHELNQQQQNHGVNQQQQFYGLNYPNPQNYGLYNPNLQNYAQQTPNPYSSYSQHNYGFAFPYNVANNNRFKNSDLNKNIDKVQRRIQNKPQTSADDENFNTKWSFPGNIETNQVNYVNSNDYNAYNYANKREVKTLKFPENSYEQHKTGIEYDRDTRGFIFPEGNSNRQYKYHNYLQSNDDNNYRIYNQYYVNKNTHNLNNGDDVRNIKIVYVVRGNGDPNNPEIINLRPGETIQ